MAYALAIFSVLLVVLSVYGVFLPDRIIAMVRSNMSRGIGIWIAVGVRLLFATLLWFTAPVSHTPIVLKVFAVLILLSAFAHQFVGRAGLKKFIETLDTWPRWAIRIPCLFGVLLGGFLLWSVSLSLGAA